MHVSLNIVSCHSAILLSGGTSGCRHGNQSGTYGRVMSSQIQELLKFQHCIKSVSFNVWVRYFVWNFKGTLWNSTQNILPIHWKMYILYANENLRAHACFWNAPLGSTKSPIFSRLGVPPQWTIIPTFQKEKQRSLTDLSSRSIKFYLFLCLVAERLKVIFDNFAK